MTDESRELPAEQVSAEPPGSELVVSEAVAERVSGAPPIAIFLGIFTALLLSIGGATLLIATSGRIAAGPSEVTPTPIVTVAPARTPGAGATTPPGGGAADRVRVASTSARSRATSGTQHEVTFNWTLEGAREGDPVVIQFYQGTRSLGQQRGTLDPGVFNFSTGTLTLTVAMECSTTGWSAELLTVRGQAIEGDSHAEAAGAQCR